MPSSGSKHVPFQRTEHKAKRSLSGFGASTSTSAGRHRAGHPEPLWPWELRPFRTRPPRPGGAGGNDAEEEERPKEFIGIGHCMRDYEGAICHLTV